MSSSTNLPAVLGGEPVVADRVPLGDWPVTTEEDVAAVADVVREGLFASEVEGDRLPIDRYEERFAAFQGAKYAVAVTNGTHTLQLMLEAAGIGLGHAVFVPGLTWQATAAAVADVNALPWLVDVERGTWAISPDALEAAIVEARRAGFTPRAAFVVHPYTRMADMDAIAEICERHGLILFEDCAHAHGAVWRGRGAGSIGWAGSFSFQRSKANTTGEGGMITTNDPWFAAVLRSARNVGAAEQVPVEPGSEIPDWVSRWIVPAPDGGPQAHVAIQSGNFRMTELQAALGIVQLERFEREQRPLRRRITPALERVAEQHEGIRTLDRQEQVDFYPQYRALVVEWLVSGWDGLPAAAARPILEAELGVEVCGPYDSLNNSPFWRPHTKPARHRLTEEYWELLDPGRYQLPESERASAKGLCFEHSFALDRDAPGQLDRALTKLRSHLPALRRWWEDQPG